MITADLMRRHTHATEGDLAWMRQAIVNDRACAGVARAAGLPDAMILEAPREHQDAAAALAARTGVQADIAEAVIGAAWLEVGLEGVQGPVLAAFKPLIDAAVPGQRDPKTALQELAARRRMAVVYDLVAAEGPPHQRTFESRALVGGEEMGSGRGRSKQASERAAATEALEKLAGAA
ncbi:MAG: ribonuclease [Miltoncostaeaceae bacterium]|nr:ribonuclease [Miltoncostaeaceae bacterium]